MRVIERDVSCASFACNSRSSGANGPERAMEDSLCAVDDKRIEKKRRPPNNDDAITHTEKTMDASASSSSSDDDKRKKREKKKPQARQALRGLRRG